MSRLSRIFHHRPKMISLCLGLVLSATAWGQQPAAYSRSTAIDQKNSRAEHEAEQMVSLSADRILFILRDEPGLLLQIKKALVRKAFEQGRILDPNDLTDDALFTLIRQDDNIRVIATHEIVDRAYIKAKPTREELARDLPCQLSMPTDAKALPPSNRTSHHQTRSAPSQEEEYWRKHENDLDCYLTQYLPYDAQPYSFGQPQYTGRLPSNNTQRRSIHRSSTHSSNILNSILSNNTHRRRFLRRVRRRTTAASLS